MLDLVWQFENFEGLRHSNTVLVVDVAAYPFRNQNVQRVEVVTLLLVVRASY